MHRFIHGVLEAATIWQRKIPVRLNMSQSTADVNLARLREAMKYFTPEPIQAYIITSEDAHQNEYLAECDKRREYISGFLGSAGTAVITEKHALMWTDGRYFLQAAEEMSDKWTLMKDGIAGTPTQDEWLTKNLLPGSRVGADPNLVPYNTWKNLNDKLKPATITLTPVDTNLVDFIRQDKIPLPNKPIHRLPIKYSGKTSKQKVEEVRGKMKEKGASLLLISALDEVAWLLNLRGSDIDYNPVFFAYIILSMNQVHLFIDESKITLEIRNHFNEEDLPVNIHSYDKVKSFLTEQAVEQTGKIWVSSEGSYALAAIVPFKHRICEISPIAVMKAIKNPVEREGMVNAHVRDAAALCRYFAWLEKEVTSGKVVTEISGADKLDQFRSEQEDYVGLSFPTISPVGPNASIIHYQPSAKSNRPITCEELYLCDSGGQYKDGTTDVTRTVHFGTPSEYEKECFTRVFKGQTFLATSVFPSKIRGNCLDSFARKYLWDVGLDYLHGTGHGVGSFLYVHEGPMGISWREYPNDPGLQEGMFLSNEPGYYEDGKFGIRLENIVMIIPATNIPHNFKNLGFLTFKTVTLVPVQTKMLTLSLLTEAEISYLNAYHKECREVVGSLLKKQGHTEAWEWLLRETEPIGA